VRTGRYTRTDMKKLILEYLELTAIGVLVVIVVFALFRNIAPWKAAAISALAVGVLHGIIFFMHRGTIVSLGEQSFVFQEKGRPPSEVPFSEVRSVQGPGMSRGAKIGLGLGIGAAAFVVLLMIGAASSAGVGGN